MSEEGRRPHGELGCALSSPANLLIVLSLIGLIGCADPLEDELDSSLPEGAREPYLTLEWSLMLSGAGEGSPSLCDLRGDGELEVLAPLSSAFAQQDETGILVAAATTGEPRLLLAAEGSHPYGSAACAPRPDGRSADILVGGRAGDIFAVDGADGSLRYRLAERHSGALPAPTYPYAFSSPVVLSKDGALAATAWTDEAEPIPRGRLILFEPSSGALLEVFEAPDGALAYASPSVYHERDGETLIVFPTGGEISTGALLILVWDGESLAVRAAVESSCEEAGFIASAHLADLDGDGEPEIIAGDYCGGVHAISLQGERLFLKRLRGTINANPVSGDFDGDGKLDILAVAVDLNPSLVDEEFSYRSELGIFRGVDGEELHRFSHAMPILSSPAVLDLNGDQFDDFILVSSDFRAPNAQLRRSGIHLYDGRSVELFSELLDYRSISSPVIDDVDGDGVPDLFIMQEIQPEPFAGRLSRFSIHGAAPFDRERAFSGLRGHPQTRGAR